MCTCKNADSIKYENIFLYNKFLIDIFMLAKHLISDVEFSALDQILT